MMKEMSGQMWLEIVKGIEQHEHAGANETEIIEEIMKDIIKHFNDEED